MGRKHKKKGKIEAKCKNCLLFEAERSLCKVVILHEGQRIRLPVEPEDDCFFEGKFTAITPDGQVDEFTPEVQQVRFWVEDPDKGGPKEGEGIVKIEYPEGFFGPDKDDSLDLND